MEYVTIIISSLSLIVSVIVLVMLLMKKKEEKSALSESDMKEIKKSVAESMEFLTGTVSTSIAKQNEEIINGLVSKNESIEKRINELKDASNKLTLDMNEFRNQLKIENQNSFTGVKGSMDSFKDNMIDKLSDEMTKLEGKVKEVLNEFKQNTGDSIGKLETTVKDNLQEIRKDNNEKLEKINESVNEKLEKTLDTRLKDSFDSVIKQIGNVNTAVGEIKTLATDVGSLKNVLANVKTKGIIGEVILGNIIREFLTPAQYEENKVTKKNSTERVEFAIKLPGTKDDVIYLPVDSKFPYEPYSRILESTDVDEIKANKKLLRENLLKYAKDVHDKYIDVPNTTEFAIIFLPIEGLYLEALNAGLFEEIQKKYNVNLTGPTTLSAFVTSLQVGFKSLLIQKRSADVFKLLGAVKTEFAKFAETLEKAQKKVSAASDELDNLVGTRTKMINSKLKSIESLDDESTKLIIESSNNE